MVKVNFFGGSYGLGSWVAGIDVEPGDECVTFRLGPLYWGWEWGDAAESVDFEEWVKGFAYVPEEEEFQTQKHDGEEPNESDIPPKKAEGKAEA